MSERFNKYGYEIDRIYDNTYRIMDNDACSNFFVIGSDKGILIDTGCATGNLKKLCDELCPQGYYVVNTHGHNDHVAANYQFEEVYIGKEDEELMKKIFLSDSEKEVFYEEMRQYASIAKGRDIIHFSTLQDKINFEKATVSFEIKYLNDGMIFDLGDNKIEAIHVPGHTAGGYCFLDKNNRRLYAGDAVLRHASVLHVGGLSITDFINGLKKLLLRENEFDLIISAHGHRQHGFRPLEVKYIYELIRCAESIDINKSSPKKEADGTGYEYYLDGKTYQDFDSVSIAFKCTSLN